jgi:hypothetical protein
MIIIANEAARQLGELQLARHGGNNGVGAKQVRRQDSPPGKAVMQKFGGFFTEFFARKFRVFIFSNFCNFGLDCRQNRAFEQFVTALLCELDDHPIAA